MSKKLSSPRNVNSITGGLSRFIVLFSYLPKIITALPIIVNDRSINHIKTHKKEPMSTEQLVFELIISAVLVLLGGCFAGLTIGLMGQDEVYLKVLATSGDKNERKHSRKVLRLISRGKHWVLITLLLSNVITNETLPIVLDRCLGGGWPAVVASTALIVIFGEIIPQSICVRYGLEVGSYCSPFVLLLMYFMYPIAYPIALLLDKILGEDHGTVYKKSGLKTLVTLHKTMGVERLNQDEVTIISAVLDLKEKSVSTIMTPIDRVFTMSADTILDEKTVEDIFNAGFSRIPIHLPGEPMNFIGMLLVRVLISYDPEDALPVASFPLATLPETGIDTSCLNILNYFQEGKSHMIVVSENPGEPFGALGVLTLEDVIEELIGEEIVDESDVYVDINNNIKRSQPGPLSKRNLTGYLHNLYQKSASVSKRTSIDNTDPISKDQYKPGLGSPKGGYVHDSSKTWKPINPADNPIETNKSFVTIKRPDIEGVKNLVSKDKHTVAVHETEQGALDHANDNHVDDQVHSINIANGSNGKKSRQGSSSSDHKFLLPNEREADISDFAGGSSNKAQISEVRSYRTGGIVESIVNVQGVHKTIIENVSDDEGFEVDDGFEVDEDQNLLPSENFKDKFKRKMSR
ncbi:protein Mam3p [[Candida] jaroonii]|uniref:Protein Mam3p n=1 Tax=[Candida] jaroonii TaxID=467808 RepID=A0ACA9Y3Y7_9ASCO|nr:protein Mam3p [[Candida] jaroonii]